MAATPQSSASEPTLELLLLVTAHRLAVEAHDALGFEQVSTMQLMALSLMTATRPVRTSRSLAAALGCARSSATEMVDRLVRDGLVDRAVDPHDRRSRLLTPTEGGRRVAEDARKALAECMASFSRSFDVEEKVVLRELLERLERGADWHRTERLWGLHEMGAPGAPRPPRRPPTIHVR